MVTIKQRESDALEPPLKIVTKNKVMKAICNFFRKKRKDKESIDQPQKL